MGIEKRACRDEHWVMYRSAESVNCTPETDIILYVNWNLNRNYNNGGAWVAQSVGHPTSVQVMILRFVISSPASGSVRTAQSLEPALDSVSPSLSAPPLLVLCFSLPIKN